MGGSWGEDSLLVIAALGLPALLLELLEPGLADLLQICGKPLVVGPSVKIT